MIRFINLTGQIFIDDPEPHFAWFTTITDEFLEFNGSYEWNTWEECKEDVRAHCLKNNMGSDDTNKYIERLKRLHQGNKELLQPPGV
ncbi:hypothetical protein LCGC14_2400380 [marine sediment metagenome]|uniref:Uncharacterized protein n=1 Tax=marine sediment metagenome TaxID=412755 RepID=A0A0F9BVL5_9ZZZZ